MFNTIMIVRKSALIDFIPEIIEVLAEKNVALVVENDEKFELLVKSQQEDKASIEIDIEDKDFMLLAKEAHKRDMTLNKLVEEILIQEIEKAGL